MAVRLLAAVGLPLAGVPNVPEGWSSIGPQNLFIQDIAVEPDDPQTVYATSAGLFKGTGRGRDWRVVDAGQSLSVAVDPREPSRVYAAGDMFHASEDRGETWTHLVVPFVGAILSVAVDPFDPATLYIGTCCGPRGFSPGVLKSTDRGKTWVQKRVGLSDFRRIQEVVLDPRTPGTLYARGEAGNDRGVFKSTDGGETWSVSLLRDGVTALAIPFDPPGRLYAGTQSGLFRSDDGGATWLRAAGSLSETHVRSIAVDPSSPRRLYVGTDAAGVFRSEDGGETWVPFNSGLVDQCVSALATDSSGRTLYAGTCSSGVFLRDVRVRSPRVLGFR